MENREIKFRAWNTDYKNPLMEYFDLMSAMTVTSNPLFKFQDKALMQYTGLKDKNGKEIYEGDIIKMGDNPECWFSPRVVEFKNGSWMGGGCRIYTNQDKYDYKGDSNQNNWEILGNIYETPELLK